LAWVLRGRFAGAASSRQPHRLDVLVVTRALLPSVVRTRRYRLSVFDLCPGLLCGRGGTG